MLHRKRNRGKGCEAETAQPRIQMTMRRRRLLTILRKAFSDLGHSLCLSTGMLATMSYVRLSRLFTVVSNRRLSRLQRTDVHFACIQRASQVIKGRTEARPNPDPNNCLQPQKFLRVAHSKRPDTPRGRCQFSHRISHDLERAGSFTAVSSGCQKHVTKPKMDAAGEHVDGGPPGACSGKSSAQTVARQLDVLGDRRQEPHKHACQRHRVECCR